MTAEQTSNWSEQNLFFSESPLGILSATPLPTGYRHLLLNIRLENGLLAGMSRAALCSLTFIRPYWRLIFLAFDTEIQFNLSSLFSVLGQEGYALHNELVGLKSCLRHEGEACGSDFFV